MYVNRFRHCLWPASLMPDKSLVFLPKKKKKKIKNAWNKNKSRNKTWQMVSERLSCLGLINNANTHSPQTHTSHTLVMARHMTRVLCNLSYGPKQSRLNRIYLRLNNWLKCYDCVVAREKAFSQAHTHYVHTHTSVHTLAATISVNCSYKTKV